MPHIATQASSERLLILKQAFFNGIVATLASIGLGFGFKLWLAQWVAKSDLALYNTVIDVISLSLILLTGFRSSMVVSYSQTRKDRDIINIFRISLILMVLLTWGLVIPYIKHRLHIDVGYFELVGVIMAMGLKVYASNLLGMYRLYHLSNRFTWIEPLANIGFFLVLWFGLQLGAMQALFYSMILSSGSTAIYMLRQRRKVIATQPIGKVQMEPAMVAYVKKSFTAALEAGASILMIYITVLLTIRDFSISELGDFQVVIRPILTYMTLLFVFPIYRFVLPELTHCLRDGAHHQVEAIKRWVFRLSGTVGVTFFAITALFGDTLIGWLFPEEYAQAAPVLTHLALFFVFMMLNAYQLAYIKANGRFTLSLAIRLTGIVTLLISYSILTLLTDNVVAVVIAQGCGYVMMFVLSMFAEHQLQRRHPGSGLQTA
ncbi:lipopolysaccharide biosynthesis protein [Ferrimonas kyonanensis]|uniref:lipopolysaccharide biosynthesis protein n=1 Tax=Ferrimonas kyonanensis TaxID=364763 RepID=UPI0003F9E6F1